MKQRYLVLNLRILILAAILLLMGRGAPVWAASELQESHFNTITGSGPPPVGPSAETTICLQMADSSFMVGINAEGQISSTLAGSMPDNGCSLSIESKTRILINDNNTSSWSTDSTLAGHVPQEIAVEIPASVPDFPPGWVQVSPAYDIFGLTEGQRHGVRMDHAALLLIQYSTENLPYTMDGLSTFYYDNLAGWTPMEPPEGFIAEAGQAASTTDHFSLFVVLAKAGTPVNPTANIVIQKMTVNPPHIGLGQSSEVKIKVTNKGGQPGDYNVVLKMGNEIQKAQLVHLSADETTEVAVLLTPHQNGIYSLTAGPVHSSLIVDPVKGPDVVEIGDWWQLYLALGVSLLLFGFFVRFYLKRSETKIKK